jgi:hypothetical protein
LKIFSIVFPLNWIETYPISIVKGNLTFRENPFSMAKIQIIRLRLSTLVHKFANVFFLYAPKRYIRNDINHGKDVIPAKAGIQENTGFPRIKYGAGLVKPGMTNYTGPIYRHV